MAVGSLHVIRGLTLLLKRHGLPRIVYFSSFFMLRWLMVSGTFTVRGVGRRTIPILLMWFTLQKHTVSSSFLRQSLRTIITVLLGIRLLFFSLISLSRSVSQMAGMHLHRMYFRKLLVHGDLEINMAPVYLYRMGRAVLIVWMVLCS